VDDRVYDGQTHSVDDRQTHSCLTVVEMSDNMLVHYDSCNVCLSLCVSVCVSVCQGVSVCIDYGSSRACGTRASSSTALTASHSTTAQSLNLTRAMSSLCAVFSSASLSQCYLHGY